MNYKWIALLIVSFSTFVGPLDVSSVLLALPTIAQALSTDNSTILWVTLAFLLSSISLTLILGWVSDVRGRKLLFAFGYLVDGIGILLASLAPTVHFLIAFRVFQGIGLAMLSSSSTAILVDAFPLGERGKALGIQMAAVGLGLSLGPLLGGVLIDLLGWRAIFYTRAPLSFLGFFLAWFWLKEQLPLRRPASFDLAGALLLMVVLASFLLMVNQWGRQGSASPLVLALGATALAALPWFILVELKAERPVVDLGLFNNLLFSGANLAHLLHFVTWGAIVALSPFYMVQALGYSPTRAGVLLTTMNLTRPLVAPLSGWLSDKVGHRAMSSLGMGLVTGGMLVLLRLGPEAIPGQVALSLVLMGLGSAMFEPPNNSAIMGAVAPDRRGTASSMIATLRQVGQSTGIALSGAVMVARQSLYYRGLLASGVEASKAKPLALAWGFQDAILVFALAAALGMVAALLSRSPRPIFPQRRARKPRPSAKEC